MRYSPLIDKTTNTRLPLTVVIAETSAERRQGLVGKQLKDGQGLLIAGGCLIHMSGMEYDLQLVFISRKKIVKKIRDAKKGFKFYFYPSWYCLEVAADTDISFLKPGQQLSWQ